MVIVDAHLDLAYAAQLGRPMTLPALDQPPDHDGIPSVGLPNLRQGGAGLICGTLFAEPYSGKSPNGYQTIQQAREAACRQLHWYQQLSAEGELRLVTGKYQLQPDSAEQVPPALPPAEFNQNQAGACSGGYAIPCIILMEGAEPIADPADVPFWFNGGVRMVGLAWRQTRYAGSSAGGGGLTDLGIELVKALDQLGIIHDVSHLCDDAFWQLLDRSGGPIVASHSNCRAIIPTPRHLTDPMILALVQRGGIIGINFYDRFLIPPTEFGQRRATLLDVVRQIQHLSQLLGDAQHIGIGSDLDGGFGRANLPMELSTWADLPRLADSLSTAGFSDAAIAGIMGTNWLGYFQKHLGGPTLRLIPIPPRVMK